MGNIYNVLIIGAGNIGAFYDTPNSENILTHAHAFSKAQEFNLLGFVDLEKHRAVKAAELWGTETFSSIEDAFSNHNIDVVCVCVPDKFHYQILKKITNFSVKLVFAEKPLAKTLDEALEIIKLYNENGIKILVNYSRRFVTKFENVRHKILVGEYGEFICGNGYYGKGTLHNGSHLIDFLRYMIGEIQTTKTFNFNYDFYKDDPSVSALLTFDNGGYFTMLNVPCTNFTIFELELVFEKKRIKILDSGFKLELYEVMDSEIFNGYKNLIKIEECNTELGSAIENAVINIYKYLNYGEELRCTLEDGYAVMVVCEKLKAGISYE
jgi:predicted dehydrogenase